MPSRVIPEGLGASTRVTSGSSSTVRLHRAGARQVPCCARVGRDVHARHGSRAIRPLAHSAASLATMRRTLSLCRSGLAAAAAVVLLTACGGSDEDTNASDSTSSSSSSSASETTENTAPQADSAFCTEAAAIQERVTASLTESGPEQPRRDLPAGLRGDRARSSRPPRSPPTGPRSPTGIERFAEISQIDFDRPDGLRAVAGAGHADPDASTGRPSPACRPTWRPSAA